MTLGEIIKMIRKERKLTQSQLSRQINISRSYLSDVENDRNNPSVKTVRGIADKLDVHIHKLIK